MLLKLAEAKDESAFEDQLLSLPEEFKVLQEMPITRRVYRAIFGLPDTPIAKYGEIKFCNDYCDYNTDKIDLTKPILTKEDLHAIVERFALALG